MVLPSFANHLHEQLFLWCCWLALLLVLWLCLPSVARSFRAAETEMLVAKKQIEGKMEGSLVILALGDALAVIDTLPL